MEGNVNLLMVYSQKWQFEKSIIGKSGKMSSLEISKLELKSDVKSVDISTPISDV